MSFLPDSFQGSQGVPHPFIAYSGRTVELVSFTVGPGVLIAASSDALVSNSFLFLVRPGAPSSVLVTTSKALVTSSFLLTWMCLPSPLRLPPMHGMFSVQDIQIDQGLRQAPGLPKRRDP